MFCDSLSLVWFCWVVSFILVVLCCVCLSLFGWLCCLISIDLWLLLDCIRILVGGVSVFGCWLVSDCGVCFLVCLFVLLSFGGDDVTLLLLL